MAKAKKAKKAAKKTNKPKILAVKPPGGIKRKKSNGDEIAVPQFSVPEEFIDGIAKVIVRAWAGDASLDQILKRTPQGWATQAAVTQATAAINKAAAGLRFDAGRNNLGRGARQRIHDAKLDDDAVVFVLPNDTRRSGADLLNTAKLLMACTPNGI